MPKWTLLASLAMLSVPAHAQQNNPIDGLTKGTSPAESCDQASVQAMAPANTTVAFAARESGGNCRVHGYVTNINPGPNRVHFVLVLPNSTTWPR